MSLSILVPRHKEREGPQKGPEMFTLYAGLTTIMSLPSTGTACSTVRQKTQIHALWYYQLCPLAMTPCVSCRWPVLLYCTYSNVQTKDIPMH
jgi:hypothetical protein